MRTCAMMSAKMKRLNILGKYTPPVSYRGSYTKSIWCLYTSWHEKKYGMPTTRMNGLTIAYVRQICPRDFLFFYFWLRCGGCGRGI